MFGIVRFDFIVDTSGEVYLNEVNTIPGSLAHYLFDKTKFPYSVLVDMLVSNAIKRKENGDKIIKTFETDVVSAGFDGLKK